MPNSQQYERTRILLDSGSSLHTLMWVDAGRDQSIYIGMLEPDHAYEASAVTSIGSKLKTTNLKFTPSYNPKISYHATGQNHFRDQDVHTLKKNRPQLFSYWKALDFLEGKPKIIALFHYPHISVLPIFNGLASKCQTIPYGHLSDMPMAGKVIAAPLSIDNAAGFLSDDRNRVVAVLNSVFCKLYIVLHTIENPEKLPIDKWPRHAGIVIPSNAN